MASADSILTRSPMEATQRMAVALARPLQLLMAVPAALFLITLTVMLFRPPDLPLYSLDRLALAMLVVVELVRILVLRQPLPIGPRVTFPLLALTLLALADLLSGPYQVQCWSVFAAKWAVPLALYHVAQVVFTDSDSLGKFETYALLVLAYLVLMAVFFLISADALVWPRYILDENLGIHFDRARGPFLQAVANGVSLNLLGIIALNSFRRRRLKRIPAVLFLIFLPLAILATKTRGVWLSFLLSALLLLFFSSDARVRRACRYLIFAAVLGAVAVLVVARKSASLSERLEASSPVEFRLAVYRTGWQMFRERPWLGWRGASIRPELSRRIDGFRGEQLVFHNSFLEVVVNHGLLGLALYLWVFADLLRLGRAQPGASFVPGGFADSRFLSLWPVMVGVYALNACFVVMNYQFVNGLIFTIAGILAAQARRNNFAQERVLCP